MKMSHGYRTELQYEKLRNVQVIVGLFYYFSLFFIVILQILFYNREKGQLRSGITYNRKGVMLLWLRRQKREKNY